MAAHGGAALFFLTSNTTPDGALPSGPRAAPPLALRLVPAQRASAAPAVQAVPTAAAANTAPAAQLSPSPATPTAQHEPAPVRYFTARELTQEPVLVDQLVGDTLLIVPGVAPQAATVTLSIDVMGNVTAVRFEKDELNEAERALVLAALQGLHFAPGKIGRIAVHSEVTRDFLLDSEIRL
ncbi:hypothetical protein SAMN05428948_1139 [Massilia sp. CF038]|nr:hypothetical protein SAMN05428948_1139 [Massilia sp. CF038]